MNETPQAHDWGPGESAVKPCCHAEPQSAMALHGVCIFCYRDRLAVAQHAWVKKLEEGRALNSKVFDLEREQSKGGDE